VILIADWSLQPTPKRDLLPKAIGYEFNYSQSSFEGASS
jgi:hypothetical protein